MKPYFIAALSFVGVLGSAAGAMAINNDTLTHGGSELTDAASQSLVTTTTVNADGTVSVVGSHTGTSVATPGSTPQAAGQPGAKTPPLALANVPTLPYNGTTGGSAATNAGAVTTPTHSAARPIATPAPGVTTPVSGVTGGSASAAPAPAPQPSAGSGSNTSAPVPPARSGRNREHNDRDHSRSGGVAPAPSHEDGDNGGDD